LCGVLFTFGIMHTMPMVNLGDCGLAGLDL